ncbi:molecular chaperone DnaJ [Salmonella enterica]|uniref:molecular chaperone DnaJ n=1 Tax=Salmonella enterica TaxID=28901 RepID=UPI00107B4D49|nr:molecular chaperone DnaJ [Salmonella enterica]EAA9477014.1 molecular chaperone DnaJ [Salmonella enterica subsp. enterica]EAS6825445.1 molecular chaperone DnaJ [Salmonella enterica subsp. enterica serovar Give]EBV6882514.1 molecular chaperone DnaJ [Salmonella enterica subsp. enterica serovar Thompson]EDB7835634.1 molecular chaperone DnaJ [Salmonella enterica subsp. enterica serovar Infantis]EDF8146768.1 molecular chaperone DnaJ [Salmonella enterica subsp. enterica serovar Tennessee]
MTTITKEEVKAFIEQIESDLANGWEAQIFELKLARIALASLEAEPIGAFHIADQLVGGTSDYIKDGEWPIDNGVIEVYAAPPATVVPEKLPCSVELKPGLIIGKGCKTETLLTALRRRADYYAKIDTFTPAERAEHDASIEAFKAMLPTPADSQGRPRAPVVPPAIKQDYKVIKSILPTANPDEYACCIAADMWNACRAAMLQGGQPVSNRDELQVIGWLRSDYNSDDKRDPNAPLFMLGSNDPSDAWGAKYIPLSGNSPVIPGGWVMVPKKLTAENGAKSLLSGEFLETTFISCPECFTDEECESCDGSGRIKIEVPVSWTTIKAIWNKGVEHFRSSTATGDN